MHRLRVPIAVAVALLANGLTLLLAARVNAWVVPEPPAPKAAPSPVRFDPVEPPEPPPTETPPRIDTPAAAMPLPAPAVASSLPDVASPDALPPLLLDLTSVGSDDGGPLIFREDAVDEPAVAVEQPRPRYPRRALRAGVTGFVEVRMRVSATGAVEAVEIVDVDPAGYFEEAAQEAAEGYRFEPARVDGRAVPVLVRRRMDFAL